MRGIAATYAAKEGSVPGPPAESDPASPAAAGPPHVARLATQLESQTTARRSQPLQTKFVHVQVSQVPSCSLLVTQARLQHFAH